MVFLKNCFKKLNSNFLLILIFLLTFGVLAVWTQRDNFYAEEPDTNDVKITFASGNGINLFDAVTITKENETDNLVQSGAVVSKDTNVTFKITLKEGYKISKNGLKCTYNSGSYDVNNGKITLNSGNGGELNLSGVIKSKINITFDFSGLASPGGANVFTLSYGGNDLSVSPNKTASVEQDNETDFKNCAITLNQGYNFKSVIGCEGANFSVQQNQREGTVNYTGEITSDLNIKFTGEIEYTSYNITFKDSSGKNISTDYIKIFRNPHARPEDSTPINNGAIYNLGTLDDGKLKIAVQPQIGYTLDSFDITVNGISYAGVLNNGEYTYNINVNLDGSNGANKLEDLEVKFSTIKRSYNFNINNKPDGVNCIEPSGNIMTDNVVSIKTDLDTDLVLNFSVSDKNKTFDPVNINIKDFKSEKKEVLGTICKVTLGAASAAEPTIQFNENSVIYKTCKVKFDLNESSIDPSIRNKIQIKHDNKIIGTNGKDIAVNDLKFTVGDDNIDASGAKMSYVDSKNQKREIQADSNGYFVITDDNTPSELTIKILNVKLKTVPINIRTLPNNISIKYEMNNKENTITTSDIINVPSGSEFNFQVECSNGGVELTKYDIEIWNGNIRIFPPQNENVTINSVTNKYNVFDVTIKKVEYAITVIIKDPAHGAQTINFVKSEGVEYKRENGESIQGIITHPYETEFKFVAKAKTGYKLDKVSLDGTELTGSNGLYTVSADKVVRPLTINASASLEHHEITFDTNSNGKQVTYYQGGVKVTRLSALHGSDVSFNVELPPECSQSNIEVKANGETLTKVNGGYKISHITKPLTVTVGGVSINKYFVNFSGNGKAIFKDENGQSIAGSNEVDYDGIFKFKVEANTGYIIDSNAVVVCKKNGGSTVTLTPVAGVYTLSNIKESCTVSVNNISDMSYTVALTAVPGVTYLNETGNVISGGVKVGHGKNFEFSISIADAYDDSVPYINTDPLPQGTEIKKISSNRYVITNVKGTITIKTENVRKNVYTVTLTKTEGIDYQDVNGKIITGDNKVEHRGELKFKVYLYPVYSESDIKVMLGDNQIKPDSNGIYTLSKISENKTVTVIGIKESEASKLVNTINNLPDKVENLSDVAAVVEASKVYESLSEEEKSGITNVDKLINLQRQVAPFHHTSNDVIVEGVAWNIKLVANPISTDADDYSRIYQKLGSEYILSLYDVYLWNTLTDTKYILNENESVVIKLPTPDMTYFENPSAMHEKSDGKMTYPALKINGKYASFQTDSFSAMGIIAYRSSTPGVSSLLDAADANLSLIRNISLNNYNSGSSSSGSSSSVNVETDGKIDSENGNTNSGNNNQSSGNGSGEGFNNRYNPTTATGSALRLILILMILAIIAVCVWIFWMNRKKQKNNDDKKQ